MRSTLRRLYRYVPFKNQISLFLRSVWKPPERIYRHLEYHGIFTVKVDDNHAFRMRHFGYPLENSLFWGGLSGCWEGVSTGLWTRLCRNANLILDVGANTGTYALIAACVRPEARVIAFEPVRRIFERLESNRDLNGFSIHGVCAALSDYTGTATIYDPGDEHLYSISVNKNAYEASGTVSAVQIPVLRLDEFIEKNQLPRIDLLKVDVETHEMEVLRGYGRYLREHRPTLLIEIRDEALAAGVEALIAGMDYLYFNIDERAGVRRVDRLGPSDYFNFLICTEETARGLGLKV
jgi:FkbM family methyltransferase